MHLPCHTAKKPANSASDHYLPCANTWAHDKDSVFAVCQTGKAHGKDPCHVIRPVAQEILPWVTLGTRQRLCRVPEKLHTAKAGFADACLPCALCRVRHTANPLPWAFRALPCPAKGASPVVIWIYLKPGSFLLIIAILVLWVNKKYYQIIFLFWYDILKFFYCFHYKIHVNLVNFHWFSWIFRSSLCCKLNIGNNRPWCKVSRWRWWIGQNYSQKLPRHNWSVSSRISLKQK